MGSDGGTWYLDLCDLEFRYDPCLRVVQTIYNRYLNAQHDIVTIIRRLVPIHRYITWVLEIKCEL